jgi:hypothetical protein
MSTKTVIGFDRIEKLNQESIPRNHHSYSFPIELSEEESRKYTESRNILQNFMSDAQLFTMVDWNYQEYYGILKNYLNAFINKDQNYLEKWPINLNVNRMALNYLSSVRTYLDHHETSLKRRFGETSSIYKNFLFSCNQAYDCNFSYRFLYKLRDYAQHCGFPIGNITISSTPKDGDLNNPIYEIEISADRDVLLSGFEWKKLKEEFEAQPQKIDINSHIDILMKCLNDINSKVTKDVFSTLVDAASYINALLRKSPQREGIPGIYQLEVAEDEKGKPTNIKTITGSPIPMNLVNAVLNGKLENIVEKIEFEHL